MAGTIFAVFIVCYLSLAALCRATTTTGCYEGRVSLNETCTSTQYILIHSAESQDVSSCNNTSMDTLWLRSGRVVHHVWELCNLQKERCTNATLEKPTFLRMNYTCVNELTSIRRYNMCSDVSEVISTPVYLQSPGYPDYYSYTTETNCTCLISVSHDQTSSDTLLTVHDMLTMMPETLVLKLINGTSKGLTTGADNSVGYILNQETTDTSSPLSLSFVPRFSGKGYFWIGLESGTPLSIAITCNGGLGTTPTSPPTSSTTSVTATNTTLASTNTTTTTTTNETRTTSTTSPTTNKTEPTSTTSPTTNKTEPTSTTSPSTHETKAMSTKTTTTTVTASTGITTRTTDETQTPTTTTNTKTTIMTMATASPSSVTPAAVGMTKDNLKTIYIVVPTVIIAMIVIIVIVIIVKKRQASNYTKSEDAVRLSARGMGEKNRFAKDNFAYDMVDNEIYESQGSLRNGSQTGSVSAYGVGVAFGTFTSEKVRPSSNEDLSDRGPGAVRDLQRGMNVLPKSATFGGEDLLTGDGSSVPSGGGEVIYAQINKQKKNNNQEGDQTEGQTSILRLGQSNERQGQTSIPRLGQSNERQDQVVSDSFPTENGTGGIYSLADDFDDPNGDFEYDVGSKSNDAEDADDDYAYAYARRHARGSSKRREPQQSLHIYDDAASDDSEYAESDTDGVYDVALDVQIDLNDDETEGAEEITDHNAPEGQKYKKQIDAIVSVQRTEL